MTAVHPVVVEKRKWDGSVSARWAARLWEEGGRTQWWTPAGTLRARVRSGVKEVTTLPERTATDGRGWIATAVLAQDGAVARYEVDATVGGEREVDGVFAFVDLDLDLEFADGRLEVQDLAEFAARKRTMGYPDAVMRGALRSLDEARALHAAGRWPFDGSLAVPGGRPPAAWGTADAPAG